jgi:hypothetical protein
MAANENKRVVDPSRLNLAHVFAEATRIAKERASSGPTGYGAVATDGQERIIVLAAPHQLDELEGPATLLEHYGDGELADAIVRGQIAAVALAKSRGL